MFECLNVYFHPINGTQITLIGVIYFDLFYIVDNAQEETQSFGKEGIFWRPDHYKAYVRSALLGSNAPEEVLHPGC